MSQENAVEPAGRPVRLASIVAVDVVGFSTLSEKDQRRAARSVENLRQRIDAAAARHGGRIFNTAGDGFMLEFNAAGAALGAINDLLDERPKGEPPIRIGAHVGDVVVTLNEDLLGHGVNVAARLQSLAKPNTALVSGEFRSMARNSPSAVFVSRGRQPLENIEQRVETFVIMPQKARQQRMLTRAGILACAALVLGVVGVFAGPRLFDLVQNMRAAPASAPALAIEAAAPAPPPVAAPQPAAPTAPTPPTAPQAGQAIRDCALCPQMIVLPAGEFTMGSPESERGRFGNEGPQRQVTIRPFAVSLYEITFADWDACLAGGGCSAYSPADRGWGRGRMPATSISWNDAQAYLRWLNRETGADRYRLPTEAEWEYAARAGAQTRYAFGDQISRNDAHFAASRPREVGGFAANAFGLFDMHGNVWEWVEDCHTPGYARGPTDGSAVTGSGCTRIYRGGGYRDQANALRAANRRRAAPSVRDATIGFRVARDLE